MTVPATAHIPPSGDTGSRVALWFVSAVAVAVSLAAAAALLLPHAPSGTETDVPFPDALVERTAAARRDVPDTAPVLDRQPASPEEEVPSFSLF